MCSTAAVVLAAVLRRSDVEDGLVDDDELGLGEAANSFLDFLVQSMKVGHPQRLLQAWVVDLLVP